jgi:ABC-type multidrug transport system fused ATPase/permease subunit
MSFFDTTPVGQLLNLFSRDLDESITNNNVICLYFYIKYVFITLEADCRLPPCNEELIQNMLALAVSVILIAIVAPWFLIAVFILAVVLVLLSRVFRCGLRDLKRLDNVSRSSIYSHVAATISGLDPIRAFEKERDLISK